MSGSATAAPSNMSNLDTPEDLDQFVQELMDNMVRKGRKTAIIIILLSADSVAISDCHSSTNNSRFLDNNNMYIV